MIKKEIKQESKTLYEGKVLTLTNDVVLCPNGVLANREIVHHSGGVGILCINENEDILLVSQYRYAYDEIVYEIPAGKLEKGEKPLLAAHRELQEETGYCASSLESLGEIYPTCGYSNERIHLYLAKGLVSGQTHFDEDEYMESNYYPLKTILSMIENGQIKDAKTLCAIYRYLFRKNLNASSK